MFSSLLLAGVLAFSGTTSARPHCASTHRGVEWAIYNNTAGVNHQVHYKAFHPVPYKKVTPLYTGVTSNVGGLYSAEDDGNNISIYGSPAMFAEDNFVLNHRGYIHVKETGTYTFTLANVDDIFLFWLGKKAYKHWTRKNADCVAGYSYPTFKPGACTFSKAFTKGQFVPFRLMYAQSDHAAGGDVTFTSPSGQIILDSSTGYSSTIVKYGCGHHHHAHKFPAWGKE